LAPQFVGSASCAATGCHGSAHLPHGASRTALARFFAADPHALAQAVLWTHRSREMTRRLLQAEAVPGTPAAPSTVLSDEQHRALLERRCVGCHATPAPLADSPGAAVAAGVECESCHGPASGWLHTHYRHGFDRATPGFLDTKDLILRAAACVACHVGPQAAAGGPQAVDHDLIAAGHPRLTFELSAYAHSLPAHWDRAADAARHGGAFHFLTHQAGQRAIADRRAAADQQADNPAAAVADFAQIDCDACHHSLAAGSWRLRPVGEATAAAHLRPIGEPLLFPRETSPPPPTAERLAWLARTFESLASGPRAGWAAYVEALLAARAVLADLEAAPSAGASSAATVNSAAAPAAGDALAAARQALDALARYLDREAFAETAAAAPPRVYDTPARYDPQQAAQRAAEAAARLDALSRQLHSAPAP
jgi:hypothetical protein